MAISQKLKVINSLIEKIEENFRLLKSIIYYTF